MGFLPDVGLNFIVSDPAPMTTADGGAKFFHRFNVQGDMSGIQDGYHSYHLSALL